MVLHRLDVFRLLTITDWRITDNSATDPPQAGMLAYSSAIVWPDTEWNILEIQPSKLLMGKTALTSLVHYLHHLGWYEGNNSVNLNAGWKIALCCFYLLFCPFVTHLEVFGRLGYDDSFLFPATQTPTIQGKEREKASRGVFITIQLTPRPLSGLTISL